MNNKLLIKNPIITEKTTELGKLGKYVFLVDKKLTVSEAKKMLQNIYNIKIIKSHVINVKSKVRRLGQSIGTKPGYKKIIITLQKGQKLDILPQ